MGLQSRRHGRALFDTEPLGKPRATRHCEVLVPIVPRSLPSLGHTQVVNSNSGSQELASEQRLVVDYLVVISVFFHIFSSMSDLEDLAYT